MARSSTVAAAMLVAAAACLSVAPAGATVVTSIPGGTVEAMPNVNYIGPGPQTFGSGITWSSTNASNQGGSVFGYTGQYGFSGNGYWDGALGPMAGVNDSYDAWGVTDTMTFSFSTPVAAVGGFLNYVPGGSTPTVIAVYNTMGTLIESYDLTFLTGGGADTGRFFGFSESSANIGSFTLTDNYVAITDLTVSGTPVSTPEPASLGLFAASLAALAFALSRRKVRA